MTTIQAQTAAWQSWHGSADAPAGFAAHWAAVRDAAAPGYTCRDEIFGNLAAVYQCIGYTASDGTALTARYLRPAGAGKCRTLLYFHDLGRGVRGWHHMTRFVALGFAVLAPQGRPAPQNWAQSAHSTDALAQLWLVQRYADVAAALVVAQALPQTDTARLAAVGEGFGAAQAVAAAALAGQGAHCAALHPFPMDLPAEFALADALHFAPLLQKPLLLGTALLDKTAPPAPQYALYNRAVCGKKHLVYPKYEHERINFFEDAMLPFLAQV